jgi:TonB-dependent starch-binding outer membrane protein SusC
MSGEQAGDIKYVDVNHDGTITSKDMVPLGTNQPTNIYYGNLGFSYKGFDVQGLLNGQGGNKIYYTGQLANPFNGGEEATPQVSQTDTWTPQNTSAKLPRLTDGGNLAFSDFYAHNGTWERIRYLQLGYSFAQDLCNKIGLKSLRIYFNAQNPFTFSSVKLLDPEQYSAGSGIYGIPIMKVYSLGLNVKL